MRGKQPPARGNTRGKNIERPGLTQDEVEELKEAFNLFDTEATGKIDPRELKSAMQSLGFESKNPTIFNLIADLEAEGRDIDFEAFLDGITSKLGNKNGINRIFDLFDDDHSGSININNVRRVAKELGETMNVSELEEMLQRASTNGK
ncbi:UNVERIFIED_CONTAM: hypothetical protein GTU68_039654 [Idotea baltica]|nr:hypothetical protein [Idotea baltica]